MDGIVDILLAHPEANIVGAACVALGATWPFFKKRTSLLWAQAVLHVGFSLHFYLLGALSGSLMNALGLFQVLAAIPLGTRPEFKKLYIAILPVIAAGAIFTWGGAPSVFAGLGLALFSLARYQTDTLKLRVFMLAAIFSWTMHDVFVLSLPALTTDVLSITTSILMIRRERHMARTAPV